MILIIHGNDLVSSRDYYSKEKDKLDSPILIEGDGLTYDRIFQAAENNTFFDSKITLAIENFFTKNKSNSLEFKKITEYINSTKDLNVIFWESNEVLFQFLDCLKPGNGENLIKLIFELKRNMEIELIFFMIVRQFRLMISQLGKGVKIEEAKRLQGWQTDKLSKQALLFQKEKLIELYGQLFEIDLAQKTGKLPYSLEKSIDIFLLGL
jgi:hypothetical protein